jgi:hypothetical protein
MDSGMPTDNYEPWRSAAPRPAPNRKPLVIAAVLLLVAGLGSLNSRTSFIGRALGTAPQPPISITPNLVGSNRTVLAYLSAVDARGKTVKKPQQYVKHARIEIFDEGQQKLASVRLEAG